jgi:hypothetical protein
LKNLSLGTYTVTAEVTTLGISEVEVLLTKDEPDATNVDFFFKKDTTPPNFTFGLSRNIFDPNYLNIFIKVSEVLEDRLLSYWFVPEELGGGETENIAGIDTQYIVAFDMTHPSIPPDGIVELHVSGLDKAGNEGKDWFVIDVSGFKEGKLVGIVTKFVDPRVEDKVGMEECGLEDDDSELSLPAKALEGEGKIKFARLSKDVELPADENVVSDIYMIELDGTIKKYFVLTIEYSADVEDGEVLLIMQLVDGEWVPVDVLPDIDEFKCTISVKVYKIGGTPVKAAPPKLKRAKFAVFREVELCEIYGKVTDTAGVPISDATVKLLSEKDKREVDRTFTDQEGKYIFTGLRPGRYIVRIEKEGYPDLEGEIEVKAGERREVNFQLGYVFEVYNYPNPVNPVDGIEVVSQGIITDGTIIRYTLSGNQKDIEELTLKIYNLAGELIWEPDLEKVVGVDYKDTTKPHYLEWSCTNTNGEPVASGIYIILLVADGEVATNKIAVIK